MTRVYKLLTTVEWRAAQAAGVFKGSAVDLADGYIHFSTAAQAGETARKYFAGVKTLLLVAFDTEALGEALKWEPSRGGDLFPHLYATLDPTLAVEERAIALADDGTPVLGDLA